MPDVIHRVYITGVFELPSGRRVIYERIVNYDYRKCIDLLKAHLTTPYLRLGPIMIDGKILPIKVLQH